MDIRVDRAAEAEPARQRQARTLGFAAGFLGRGGCLPFAVPRVPAFPQIPVFLRIGFCCAIFYCAPASDRSISCCPGKSASKNLLVMSQLVEKPEARRPSGLDKVLGKLVSSVQESDRNIM